jgi:hypothetical protein
MTLPTIEEQKLVAEARALCVGLSADARAELAHAISWSERNIAAAILAAFLAGCAISLLVLAA